MTTDSAKEIEYKYTKVPFTIEEMKEYFLNKNKFFIINYKDSELRGNRFLSYVGNLEVPFEIDYTGVSLEERSDLVKEFLKSRNIIKFDSLALTVAEILLCSRGITNMKLVKNSLLNIEEMKEFIQNNQEVIDRWNTFLLSTNLFMLTTSKELNSEYLFKTGFTEIDDANYLGQNVVQLFSVPAFMETYLSVPADREIFYFTHQFEEYIYKGKNLFHYFNCPENVPFMIFDSLLRGNINPEQLQDLKVEVK